MPRSQHRRDDMDCSEYILIIPHGLPDDSAYACFADAQESAGFIINAPSNGGRIKSCAALPEIASEYS